MKRAQDAQTILLRCIGESHKIFPYFNPSDHFTQGHFISRTFIMEITHIEMHPKFVHICI